MTYTHFTYRLRSGWSPYPATDKGWLRGSYASKRPLAKATVLRRLRANWRLKTNDHVVELRLDPTTPESKGE